MTKRARTYFSKAAEAAPAGVDQDSFDFLLARCKDKNCQIVTQSKMTVSCLTCIDFPW